MGLLAKISNVMLPTLNAYGINYATAYSSVRSEKLVENKDIENKDSCI